MLIARAAAGVAVLVLLRNVRSRITVAPTSVPVMFAAPDALPSKPALAVVPLNVTCLPEGSVTEQPMMVLSMSMVAPSDAPVSAVCKLGQVVACADDAPAPSDERRRQQHEAEAPSVPHTRTVRPAVDSVNRRAGPSSCRTPGRWRRAGGRRPWPARAGSSTTSAVIRSPGSSAGMPGG